MIPNISKILGLIARGGLDRKPSIFDGSIEREKERERKRGEKEREIEKESERGGRMSIIKTD